jgi:hypothetical protein
MLIVEHNKAGLAAARAQGRGNVALRSRKPTVRRMTAAAGEQTGVAALPPGVTEALLRLRGVGAKRGNLTWAAKHLVHLAGV